MMALMLHPPPSNSGLPEVGKRRGGGLFTRAPPPTPPRRSQVLAWGGEPPTLIPVSLSAEYVGADDQRRFPRGDAGEHRAAGDDEGRESETDGGEPHRHWHVGERAGGPQHDLGD